MVASNSWLYDTYYQFTFVRVPPPLKKEKRMILITELYPSYALSRKYIITNGDLNFLLNMLVLFA